MDNSPKAKSETNNSPVSERLVLAVLLLTFTVCAGLLAFNLKEGIVPDEKAHFIFAKYYASTWGIPPDVPETYAQGWYIAHYPFLYHWLAGRVINLTQFLAPAASDRALLVVLRLTSVLFAVGTLFMTYLLSRELIRKKWWPLLPVFLLANTLMFTFLAGGANYDNLTNLLCTAALYFLMRIFGGRDYLSNSLGWLICICLACLVKFAVLPLALLTFLAWLGFSIWKRKTNFPLPKWNAGRIVLLAAALLLVLGNLGLYGYNLLVFREVLPDCEDMFQTAQCALSPYNDRLKELGLPQKLTIPESIRQGYPDPLEYLTGFWFKDMLTKTYGILGHKSYFPEHIITVYQLFYLGMLLLAARFWHKPTFAVWSALGIIAGFVLAIFVVNFESELTYGFKQISLQGRYLFPVIALFYALTAYTQSLVKPKFLRVLLVVLTCALFVFGGPIKFLTLADKAFAGWFLP